MPIEIDLKELPIEVGPQFEGERIRWKNTAYEFGGPKIDKKFELVQAADPKKIQDGKVIVIGPKMEDLQQAQSYPLGILIEVAGGKMEKDLEAVFERRIHEYTNFGAGCMHLNQRYDIHVRISDAAVKKGFNFEVWGKMLYKLYSDSLGIFDKMQITFITDPAKVADWHAQALQVYRERDQRALAMRDEDVDTFYGCVLCQSFAPSHVCIISPDRMGSCGALNWFDTRAAASLDPEGANFPIPKGDVIDAERGEYSGVNEIASQRSMGEIKRVQFHSLFGKPHTSCGCFEAIAFYVPEVDGFAIVNRDYPIETVNGLSFATMATNVGGGLQTEGFVGVAVEYLRSPKFFQADGGYQRLVWIPKAIRERIRDSIPEDMVNKIATEDEAKTLDELKAFLKKVKHPVVDRWVEEAAPVPAVPATAASAAIGQQFPVMQMPTMTFPVPGQGAPGGIGGLKITLKNVRIYAEKMIIKRSEG
jgi:acetyl-CoA decarbonylase/synthase complex subunit beta